MDSYGFIALIPVICVIVVSVTTRRTLSALLCGTIVGSLILAKGGFIWSWIDYLYLVLSDGTVQWLLLVVALFGALITLFERSGAVTDFGRWLEKFVTSRKKSLILTYILGIVIFLDDYLNNLTVGTTMKKLTDNYKVPRPLLGYIVNSTAAPVCVLLPLSTWAVFFGGLLENEGVTANGTGMGAYIQSIPFIFYGWISLVVVLLVVLGVIPMIGPMKKYNDIAMETGEVFPEGSKKPIMTEATEEVKEEIKKKANPLNFLIPIIVMICVTLYYEIDIIIGSIAALIAIFILYLAQRKMSLKDMTSAAFDGIASMFFVMVLTCLAFMVQKMNLDLYLAEYVISVVEPLMYGAFLPMVVFLVCAVYAYATGCFWDLAAIITPIVIPLAIAMNVDPILAAAAIFSGAAFGSNTCLYGDAIILASSSTEIDPVTLMLASLPYAAIAGGLSAILYLITGFIFY